MTRIRLIGLAAALIAGSALLPGAEARAHGAHPVHPVHPAYAYREQVYRHGVLPHWLLYDAGFLRWYHVNHYRYGPWLGWHRLHRHYLRDHRYHRHHRHYRKGHHRGAHHRKDSRYGYKYRDHRDRSDRRHHRRGH